MDEFTEAYIIAALWSTTDDSDDSGGVPMDQNYSKEDISSVDIVGIAADCAKFQEDNQEALEAAYELYTTTGDGATPVARAGHDFWLTRNGHGTGFWDHELGDAGDKLTVASEAFWELWPYVGDDGQLYGFA